MYCDNSVKVPKTDGNKELSQIPTILLAEDNSISLSSTLLKK